MSDTRSSVLHIAGVGLVFVGLLSAGARLLIDSEVVSLEVSPPSAPNRRTSDAEGGLPSGGSESDDLTTPKRIIEEVRRRIERIRREYGVSVEYRFAEGTNEEGATLQVPAEAVPPRMLLAVIDILDDALGIYPKGILDDHLAVVMLCANIKSFRCGEIVAGKYDRNGNVIYLSTHNQGWDHSATEIAHTFHHELSSFLFHREPFPADRWLQEIPADFEYGQWNASRFSRADVRPEAIFQRGFVSAYGMTSVENDFNEFAGHAFARPGELERIGAKYPRVKRKHQILRQFYGSLSPDFSERLGSATEKANPTSLEGSYDGNFRGVRRPLPLRTKGGADAEKIALCDSVSRLFRRGEYLEALDEITRPINESPQAAVLYAQRGEFFFKFGLNRKAAADCSKAISFDDCPLEAHRTRALAYADSGRPTAALTDWETLVARDPTNPRYFRGRARTYMKMGLTSRVRRDFEQARHLEDSRWNLAKVLLLLGISATATEAKIASLDAQLQQLTKEQTQSEHELANIDTKTLLLERQIAEAEHDGAIRQEIGRRRALLRLQEERIAILKEGSQRLSQMLSVISMRDVLIAFYRIVCLPPSLARPESFHQEGQLDDHGD